MGRWLVITISSLILALAALTMAGLLGPAGAPASTEAAPYAMPARSPALTAADAEGVATLHLAPGGMSGEFAKTHCA